MASTILYLCVCQPINCPEFCMYLFCYCCLICMVLWFELCLHLEPLHQPFFVMVPPHTQLWWVFLRWGLLNYLPGLALNHILLISASWVARVIVMSHWCLTALNSWSSCLSLLSAVITCVCHYACRTVKSFFLFFFFVLFLFFLVSSSLISALIFIISLLLLVLGFPCSCFLGVWDVALGHLFEIFLSF
jgi:hypothetical protein